MKRIIQVKIYRGEKFYVAECVDLPVVTQGKTLDEVVDNVREAIDLHLEGENLEDWEFPPIFLFWPILSLSQFMPKLRSLSGEGAVSFIRNWIKAS